MVFTVFMDSSSCCGEGALRVAKPTSASIQGWSGKMAAGDGKAGAVLAFSFTASEAGTNGTIPPMVARVCGDLKEEKPRCKLAIDNKALRRKNR